MDSHAIHIQNLIEQDDDCQVVDVSVAIEQAEEIKDLKAQRDDLRCVNLELTMAILEYKNNPITKNMHDLFDLLNG